MALLLDEFTYLLASHPAVAGILQNAWDHVLKEVKLMLVISGSHLGMMQRHALSPQAPLYGRATAQLHLQPLPFGVTKAFFPRYKAAERVALYAMLGGVPAYWERVEQKRSVSENIRRQLLTPNNLMQEEPRLLLQDFLIDSPNYVAILRAIADNCRTQKQISDRTGLPQGHVSKYVDALGRAGFVQRRLPVTESEISRKGRYHITDPYLRFYYRFLATRLAQMALGVSNQALAEIKQHLLDFIGTHTWEELCREWVLRAAAHGKLPFAPDQVGSLWTSRIQIDVAGINRRAKTLILGECKWSPHPTGEGVLKELVAKTDQAIPSTPKRATWPVFYLGFSRGGWSDAAMTYARQCRESGSNWKGEGMRLLDIKVLDADLIRWSEK
jgi:AAA+ ATPase superfamily predicted ATPase